jgi:hypothetical protein
MKHGMKQIFLSNLIGGKKNMYIIVKNVSVKDLNLEGTFSKRKLPGKKIVERKGYHLNTATYELEEC